MLCSNLCYKSYDMRRRFASRHLYFSSYFCCGHCLADSVSQHDFKLRCTTNGTQRNHCFVVVAVMQAPAWCSTDEIAKLQMVVSSD